MADWYVYFTSLFAGTTLIFLAAYLVRALRRSPEEIERNDRAYRQVELTGNLQRALTAAEGLPDVDLVAVFERVLNSTDRQLPPDETQKLRNRLTAIEQRFPDRATVDKISSANEAILATKIEGLEREVERLRSDSLDRWDVAQVLLALLAAVSAVAGVVFGVVRFL